MAKTRVVVVGQGYVGLPLAMAAARAGYEVVGFDIDENHVRSLARGESPTLDVLSSELLEAIREGWYKPSASVEDLEGFQVALITVPTPLKNGAPDLSIVREATASLGKFLRPGSTVILESTSYPGTTEEIVVKTLQSESGLLAEEDFFAGFSPERIDPGNEHWGFNDIPKIVSGVGERSLEIVRGFYGSLGVTTVDSPGIREAEMAKLIENTFRHVNIALVNELLVFSAAINTNLWAAIELAGTKPFGFMKFTPGPGVGGHCLPVDPTYLSWAIAEKTGREFRFVALANEVNGSMPDFVVLRAEEILDRNNQPLFGATILVAGLGYKEKTSDIRNSPGLELAKVLHGRGAKVYGFDEQVKGAGAGDHLQWVDQNANLTFDLGIITNAQTHTVSDWIKRSSRSVLDCRNSIQGDNVEVL
jgi:nucleotide sugar dehydrogenase